MITLTRERKIIFIGGAILLLFGIFYRFFPAIEDVFLREGELLAKEVKLLKYQHLLKEQKSLHAQIAEMKHQVTAAESSLLKGQTPALAAADMQKLLGGIAQESEIQIKTLQIITPVKLDQGNYLEIPLQMTITSSIGDFFKLLYGIESASTLLNVTQMNIRSLLGGRNEEIQSSLTITGYMLPLK